MSPNIRVDADVYKALQKIATPFVDTPNNVLRRILNLDPDAALTNEESLKISDGKRSSKPVKRNGRKPARVAKGRTRKAASRAPAGILLPEDEYMMPLLSVLAERGGSAPIRQVIEAVGKKLDGRLTPMDREKTSTGSIRWQNRLQFVRLKLVEEGLLAKGSPRGVWVLTDDGRARLNGRVPEK